MSRVILVTGGGSGIGAAISQTFLSKGDTVVIAQRSQPSVECAEYIACDLSNLEGIPNVVEELIDSFGRLDVLVNNAGMMQESSAEDLSLEGWQQHLDVNLSAPFMLIKHALPYLKQAKGSIVNISSIEGLGANPLHSAYCASKAGLNGLTKAIAVDAGPAGVRCNAVAPGWIDSEFNQAFIDSQTEPENFKNNLSNIHPVRRIGCPQDVAELVYWLSSSAAGFVTGQVWTVDGGRMTQISLP